MKTPPPNRVRRAARGVSDSLEKRLDTEGWSMEDREQFKFDCGVLVGYVLGRERNGVT